MTNERLNALQIRVARANTLAEELDALSKSPTEAEGRTLDYTLRCEIYRLGREELMKRKGAELEAILSEPQPDAVETSATVSTPPCLEMGTQLV